ncbi:UNVERIFIED_CONTAM: Asparagine--tRNA ligase, cytoplasmic 1, partial [Sesamum radiatum]
MQCAEAYFEFLCEWLVDHCYDDMELMAKFIDKTALQRLEVVAQSMFPRVGEAVANLEEAAKVKKFENKVEWGIDLASEHERWGNLFAVAIAKRIMRLFLNHWLHGNSISYTDAFLNLGCCKMLNTMPLLSQELITR